MSKNSLDELGLFTELSELEQSLISGGVSSSIENKLYKSTEQENIADKYTNVQGYNSTQFSISESFAIPEYGNNYLTGSSTLSISADTTSSSNIIFSEYPANQISSQSEILNNLPTESKETITKLLETNTNNSFGLSITTFSASIYGEENLTVSSNRGSINSSSSWSLNVETVAVSGLFLSGNQSSSVISQSDISNLIPAKYQQSITQFLGKRNISDLGLSLTSYSADLQKTQNLEINGIATSAKIISTDSLNIDTAALSGIFVSRKPLKSGSLSEVNNPQMIDSLGLETENSLFFSETPLLDINTTSGILGSTANLSSFLQRVEFEDLSENIFLENDLDNMIDFETLAPTGGLKFGISNTYFDSERYSNQSYSLFGEINSLETVVDSILGINLAIPNDTNSQPVYSSQAKSDLFTNPQMETSLDNDMNFATGGLDNYVGNDSKNTHSNIPFLSDNYISDRDNSSLSEFPQISTNIVPFETLQMPENLSLSEILLHPTVKPENDINAYPITESEFINFSPNLESKIDFIPSNQSSFTTSNIAKQTIAIANAIPATPNLSVAFFDISSSLTTPVNVLGLPLNMNNNNSPNYLTLLTNRRKDFSAFTDRPVVPEFSKKSAELKQKKSKKN